MATPGGVRAIRVLPIVEPGIDVDAAGLVSAAVRRAVARGPSTHLARGDGEASLRVRLVDSKSALAPMADPGARAAQYRVTIALTAELSDVDGNTIWRSASVLGAAEFLSVADGVEALDGARRRALARAADDAANNLLAAMTFGR